MSEMKITAGLGEADSYVLFAKSRVDEVFCGYVPVWWNEKYKNFCSLNRREVLFYHVNISQFSEMQILSNICSEIGIPVAVTFNSLYYTKEQMDDILNIVRELQSIGFNNFIIADLCLIKYLKNNDVNCNVYLSGEMGEINSASIDLIGEMLGDATSLIKRIIFNRNNTCSDMKKCIEHIKKNGMWKYGKYMEYEAFVLNEKCQFTGSMCNSLHCDELVHMCKMPYKIVPIKSADVIRNKHRTNESYSVQENMECYETDLDNEYIVGNTGCSLCYLPEMKRAGITHLKVVGRGNSPYLIKKDIEKLKESLEILENSKSEKEYINKMKNDLFEKKCSRNCIIRVK